MKRVLLLLFSICMIAGCAETPKTGEDKVVPQPSKSQQAVQRSESAGRDYTAMVSKMTTEQKVGQLFVVSFSGKTLNNNTAQFLRDTKIGNVILFSKNCSDGGQIAKLNQALQENIMDNTGIPAFIGIDQEGGRVTRITKGVTCFPGAMAVSAAGDTDDAYTLGDYMGQELRALGINMDFAPVCDINSNPKNPVINSRAYGDTAETVSAFSGGMFQGLQNENVVAVAKHFPGHGDTETDSHYGLPRIDKSMEQLTQQELVPFQNAVDHGIAAVMTTHILFPQIEKEEIPATLSKTILTGVLRDKMGFNGLIVTDSMRMSAISKYYGMDKACVKAVNAGADLLITGSGGHKEDDSFTPQLRAYHAVLTAVKNGTISGDTLNLAVIEILETKDKYGILDSPNPSGDLPSIDYAEHQRFANEVSLRSITVVKDEKKLIPLTQSDTLVMSGTTAVQLDEKPVKLAEKNSFAYLLSQKLKGDYLIMPAKMTDAKIKEFADRSKKYDKVVITCNMAPQNNTQVKLINAVSKANANTVLVSLASPYDVSLFDSIGTYVCAYEYTPLSVRSLIKILSGEEKAGGVLPVTLA